MSEQPGVASSAPHGPDAPPSSLIDAKLKRLADWRGTTLGAMRELIKQAVPDVIGEVKWRKPANPDGVPVWSRAGIICTGEVYRDKIKLTFAKGARVADPAKLFNASLEGGTRRAIDLYEGDGIDAIAFKALVRAAAAVNTSGHARGNRGAPAQPD